MFKINIHNLKDGEHTYEFTVNSKDFDFNSGEVDLLDDTKITAVLYKAGNQISVKIELKGKFRFQCDWCTEEYIHDFNTKFNIVYKYIFRGSSDEINEDDDLKLIQPNTIYIDLKDDIRDFILLSVPMRKVPEEADGICTYCKKNISERFKVKQKKEINPVWDKLIQTKKLNK